LNPVNIDKASIQLIHVSSSSSTMTTTTTTTNETNEAAQPALLQSSQEGLLAANTTDETKASSSSSSSSSSSTTTTTTATTTTTEIIVPRERRYTLKFAFDSLTPCSVHLYWGVPSASVDLEIFGPLTKEVSDQQAERHNNEDEPEV
jgi:hypothetical protein